MAGMSSDQVSPDAPRETQAGLDDRAATPPPGTAEASMLSLAAVRAEDQAGVCGGVLEVMAVLPAAGVRRDLLHVAGQAGVLADGRRAEPAVVDQAVERLAGRSLVRVSPDDQTVTAHGQVRRIVRDGLARHERLAAVCLAAGSVLEAQVQALASSLDLRAVRDIPRQVAALAEAAGQADDHVATLLLRLRFLALYHLIKLGDTGQAIAVGQPLVADLDRLRGAGHPDTLNAQSSLAVAYLAVSRVDEAISLFQQTLAGRQRLLGPDHRSTLNSQNNLAAAYLAAAHQDAGRTAEAVLLFETTLAARERLLGPDHPSTLTSRGNLANAYQDVGRAAEAIPLLEQTLASRERVLGPDHLDTVTVRNKLAQARQHRLLNPGESPGPDPVQETLAAATGQGAPRNVLRQPEAARELEGPSGRPVFPRRMRVLSTAAAVLILLAAAGVTLSLSGHHRISRGGVPASGAVGGGDNGLTAAAAVQMAAAWVGQQISRSAIVACDPAMCSVLVARGVPAANLLMLPSSAASPRGAQVIVATPAVRSRFGRRLASAYAPSVLAGFGSGAGQVEVRVIAPDGATAYLAALRQDMAARTAAGAQLLANKRIRLTTQARTQLAAGQVDSRLLLMLPIMSAVHPIDVLAFGDSGPGASQGVPFCSADLSGSGAAAGMTDAAYLRWLASFVRAQPTPFAGRVVLPRLTGQPVVQVEFSRPSPLGLLHNG